MKCGAAGRLMLRLDKGRNDGQSSFVISLISLPYSLGDEAGLNGHFI